MNPVTLATALLTWSAFVIVVVSLVLHRKGGAA